VSPRWLVPPVPGGESQRACCRVAGMRQHGVAVARRRICFFSAGGAAVLRVRPRAAARLQLQREKVAMRMGLNVQWVRVSGRGRWAAVEFGVVVGNVMLCRQGCSGSQKRQTRR